VPVFNRPSRLEGVLTISRPTLRLSKRKWLDIAVLVIETASEVSRALVAP